MICSDGQGIPLAVMTETASRHEVKLVEPLLEKMTLQNRQPLRLIYDKAADSDPLRTRLRERGIDLICPHKRNRKKAKTQDGRKLRRYKRRWKIERSIAWLHNYRRIVTRWEYHAHLFLGFVKLACMFTLLKRF
jgi:transposase